ncbi:MAG: FecR family protein [Bacteroidota bacterium]
MGSEIDYEKLARYFAGEASEEERRQIEDWMEVDPVRRQFVESMKRIWDLSGKNAEEWDADSAWSEVSRRINISPVSRLLLPARNSFEIGGARHRIHVIRPLLSYVWKAAAVIAFLIGISYVVTSLKIWRQESREMFAMREISTEKGQQARLKFIDGTKVVLDAASVIRFPEKFSQGVREVHLRGEAFFDVVSIEGVPFVVHARGAVIKVLGTEFNVKAYPEDKQIEVVVVRGKVSVKSEIGTNRREVVLTRGLKVHVYEDGELATAPVADLDKHLAWLNGGMVFENTEFRYVLNEIERRCNLVCRVSDSTLLSRHLTATLKDEPVSDLLKIVALAMDLKYTRTGKSVVFSPRRSRGR